MLGVELVYPSMRWPNDLGQVKLNVMRIMESDLILFDLTPTQGTPIKINEGVMIEYGIMLALANSKWLSQFPKPSYRIFLSSRIARREITTPILNSESIIPYDEQGRPELLRMLRDEIDTKVNEIIASWQRSARASPRNVETSIS
jgi:hypothetical protein